MRGIDFAVYISPDLVNKFNKQEIMEKTVVHKATSRGHSNQGWLDSYNTFSFSDYYHPERVSFGMLRVLNDDIVAPGKGFSIHGHHNMEIITIPLEGALQHSDNLGNNTTLKTGEVQVISAGTGFLHSETNLLSDRLTKFLEIWILPDVRDTVPRLEQFAFTEDDLTDDLFQVVGPRGNGESAWMNQEAWIHLGRLSKGFHKTYKAKKPGNGIYIFVLKGEIDVNGRKLRSRDGIGLWDVGMLSLTAAINTDILTIEVPMK